MSKSGPNLTFDPLPPANKNFRGYDIWLRLKASISSKFMPKTKKSNEAFLRYFENVDFYVQNELKWGPVD